jgi:mannose-1-phosphate guanylyltransferase
MSRAARPKQFLPLTNEVSLYQQTLLRTLDPRYVPPIIVTNERYRFLAAEQALEAGVLPGAILLEPEARNTAIAAAAAAQVAIERFGHDCILHILPSDHAVEACEGYSRAVDQGAVAAATGALVTFGVCPTAPETGYGYIQPGPPMADGVHAIQRFVEKPDVAQAEAMLASGGYLWNTGMFMFRAATFLSECETLATRTHATALAAVENATIDSDFTRLASDPFAEAPDISIDYAIFEKTSLAAVVPVSFPWSDLGAWNTVWQAGGKDDRGNVAHGAVTFSNARNTLVVSEKAHVAVAGLEGIAVIASEDAIFVGSLAEAQKVGPLVKSLRQAPATTGLTETHATAYRPWGGYATVLSGERFQVKRLFVKPGKQLSLQRHHHRAEHWVVVRGTAEVTLDGDTRMLSENQSVYLPVGAIHRLTNPGKIMLELIEVQTGSYLGEDDIVRLEDDFGRN